MRAAIYAFSIFSFCLAMLTLLDRGMIAGAAITGGLTLAGAFTLLFCGVPGVLRSVYGAIFNTQELHMRGLQIRQQQHSADVIALRAGSNLAFKDLTQGNEWQFFGPAARHLAETPQEEMIDTGELRPLLPALSGFDRLLIIGGPGSGKTSLLRHLVSEKAEEGHVIIADSHAAPDSWPHDVQVCGMGRDYPEIEATVNWLCEELDHRYKLRSSGRQKRFDKLYLVIDEGYVLCQFLDIRQQIKSLLAEGRKVGIGIIFAGHSDRAGALALTGNKDMSAGYEKVIYLARRDGRHIATVKNGIGDKEFETFLHPGPWGSGSSGGRRADTGTRHRHPDTERKPSQEAENGHFRGGAGVYGGQSVGESHRLAYDPQAGEYIYEPEPVREIFEAGDSRAAQVIRLAKSGASITEISKTVFGSKGGRQSKIIRGILSEFGLTR